MKGNVTCGRVNIANQLGEKGVSINVPGAITYPYEKKNVSHLHTMPTYQF